MTDVEIHTRNIKLGAFMKYRGLVYTGGDAKGFIQEGSVKVNGQVCSERGKKLTRGDIVEFDGREYRVKVL